MEEEYLPVWMSLTTPASAPRAVGLAMALGTQPIAPPETPIHQQKSFIVTEENGKITVLDDVKNVNSNGEERGTNKKSQDINRAFQILEQRIWSCMRCNNPEQVVQMFFHEEFEPVVESVLNIAQDDRNIYDGRIDRGDSTEKYVAVENTKATSTVAESGKMNKNIDLTARNGRETANRCEVLPLAIQLHPFYAERNPNGFFKLFFYNEECIAVTQLSPWAHYPEVSNT